MLHFFEKKDSKQGAYYIRDQIKNICPSRNCKQSLEYLNYYAIKQY